MPWVIAELRGKRVYARADATGKLLSEGGRVEVRYNKNDGRLYRAAARNLTVLDPQPLPDDTCGEAAEVAKSARGKATPRGKAAKAPAEPVDHAAHLADGAVVAYTDGACSGNPGPAGLGVVVLRPGERVELYEYLGQGTNNVAELTAILRALEEIDEDRQAIVYTDSSYAIGVLQKGWKAKANAELVGDLRRALAAHGKTRLVYVPGHAGVELNERADELARRAIRERSHGREVHADG